VTELDREPLEPVTFTWKVFEVADWQDRVEVAGDGGRVTLVGVNEQVRPAGLIWNERLTETPFGDPKP
jgi:hypothetical protein